MRRALPMGLACALVALGAAAPAQAGKGLEVGLQDDGVFLQQESSPYPLDTALRQARDLGVTRIRVNVIWDRVMGTQNRLRTKPRQVNYDWGDYDNLIDAAALYGIRVQFTLTGPVPAWAAGNRRPFSHTNPNVKYFGEFARDAAEHFEGRVDRYSIWNEPNWKGWLAPQSTAPKRYRGLYSAAYDSIKAVDPSAKVLIGELVPYVQPGRAIGPLAFLRNMTCRNKDFSAKRSCPALRADGFAHHPYDFKRSPRKPHPEEDSATMGNLRELIKTLDELHRRGALVGNRGRLKLYLTEFGYFSSGTRQLGAAKRANYLRQAFEDAARHPRVKQLVQYVLVKPEQLTSTVPWDTSIVGTDGVPQRPYNALLGWARRAAAQGRIQAPKGPIGLKPRPQPPAQQPVGGPPRI